jgi:hypothetical protein
MVVQRELNSLPECLLVCNLVVMEWTAAITGDLVGLFPDFLVECPLINATLINSQLTFATLTVLGVN